jgi:hypothetical protein
LPGGVDIFTDEFGYLTFRLVLRSEIERTGLAELVLLDNTLNGDREQIWRELTRSTSR